MQFYYTLDETAEILGCLPSEVPMLIRPTGFDKEEVDALCPNPNEFLKLEQCAVMAKVTPVYLRTLINQGDFPQKVAKGFRLQEVEDWLKDRAEGKPLPASGKFLRSWPIPDTYRVEEILERTSIGIFTLKSWVARGDFPAPVAKSQWSKAEVDAWMEKRRQGQPLPASGATSPLLSADQKYYSLQEVCEIGQVGKVPLNSWIRTQWFPDRISPEMNAWDKDEVDAWLRDRQNGYPIPGTMHRGYPRAFSKQYKTWRLTHLWSAGKGQPDRLEGPPPPWEWLPKKRGLTVQPTHESLTTSPIDLQMGHIPASFKTDQQLADEAADQLMQQRPNCSHCKASLRQKNFDPAKGENGDYCTQCNFLLIKGLTERFEQRRAK